MAEADSALERTAGASGSRPRLDRARVLAAGIEVADAEGLAAVSMRALAARLGVVPMALYKHVADKEDLVGGLIDTVIAGYAPPAASAAWREKVRERVLTARVALLRHPWLRQAIESRQRPSEAVLDYQNAVAGDLIEGGVSVDLTHHALHALGNRIWGFSPEAFQGAETAAGPVTPPVAGIESANAEQAAMMQFMMQRYPHVTAIALDAATRNPEGACNAQSEFEFTLDLLLDAIERLHAAQWESGAH